ncbi:hypothetical protein D9615_007872 [Tricholomella constricta]|uniref:Uncharacterized protein n=1 Tax=Tricholomella constricta TaxID=117010 RepID=A0A8H5H4N4_9AGAR|nr:hypothetical protein D9615_007872 [Tricholomella constricta]
MALITHPYLASENRAVLHRLPPLTAKEKDCDGHGIARAEADGGDSDEYVECGAGSEVVFKSLRRSWIAVDSRWALSGTECYWYADLICHIICQEYDGV